MDRSQAILMGLPALLFFSDLISLFTTSPPPPPPKHLPHHPGQFHPNKPYEERTFEFPAQRPSSVIGNRWSASTIHIEFCASCSYRGAAVNMKNMLEREFPGILVTMANYPPSFHKRVLSKVVPVVQFGVIGMIMAGEQIFPRLGLAAPPQWYYSLRANKFGSIAGTWLFGNFIQNTLQSSGAFEVQCDGQLVFSKLTEGRFPGEIELRELVRKQLFDGNILLQGK